MDVEVCSHLDGLVCHIVDGPGGTDLVLVRHHVTQPLVVHSAHVDVGLGISSVKQTG